MSGAATGGSTGMAGRDGGAGAGTGGRTATGGTSAAGGATATGGASGAGGTTADGGCVKGQTKGSDVVIIGESFIQLSTIPEQIEKDAVAAGSLKSGDKYINNAVSGMTLAGDNVNSIPNQYAKAAKAGALKYVLMDGGGNDCLLNNNGDAALAAAKTLFQTMGQDKVAARWESADQPPADGRVRAARAPVGAPAPAVRAARAEARARAVRPHRARVRAAATYWLPPTRPAWPHTARCGQCSPATARRSIR